MRRLNDIDDVFFVGKNYEKVKKI